jgi:hypothetical protein
LIVGSRADFGVCRRRFPFFRAATAALKRTALPALGRGTFGSGGCCRRRASN